MPTPTPTTELSLPLVIVPEPSSITIPLHFISIFGGFDAARWCCTSPAMVVIVDLDAATPPGKPLHHSLSAATPTARGSEEAAQQRPNPNVNGFSAALSCYP